MTLYLNKDTGELVDESGEIIGVAEGPPFSIPGDAQAVIERAFPSDNASVPVKELQWTLAVAGGDVEFGKPE